MEDEEIGEFSESTSEPIYEAFRRRQLEGKARSRMVFVMSSILAICGVFTITILQYDDYQAFVKNRLKYINATKVFCDKTDIANVDLLSTPIAIGLIIFYTILYKRRVFWRNKYRYRNVGLPMIVSCWNKTNRLLSSFTYGLIAFNVYSIAKSALDNNPVTSKVISTGVDDPSGLLALLIKVIEVFLIGVRYYPVLVGRRYCF
jgi:hypothetical protein